MSKGESCDALLWTGWRLADRQDERGRYELVFQPVSGQSGLIGARAVRAAVREVSSAGGWRRRRLCTAESRAQGPRWNSKPVPGTSVWVIRLHESEGENILKLWISEPTVSVEVESEMAKAGIEVLIIGFCIPSKVVHIPIMPERN